MFSICLKYADSPSWVCVRCIVEKLTNIRQAGHNRRVSAHHSIRSVAAQTGVSMHNIRAWERRYGALDPTRTDTNRRMYTDDDIERLTLFQTALTLGHSIGPIAGLSTEELRKLVVASGGSAVKAPSSAGPSGFLGDCERAIDLLDATDLDAALSRAVVVMGAARTLEDVVVPLLGLIDRRQNDGTFQIAHEHLFSATVRSFLERTRASLVAANSAPRVLVTTPVGQIHEIGALIVALVCALEGWHVTYLGPNLPAVDIARAARTTGARLVALSIVWPLDDPRLPDDLRALRDALPANTQLLAGGRGSGALHELLDEIGADVVLTLEDLRVRLAR